MTTWVENPRGGRDRGPRGLARAWLEVLVRPRRFFTVGVAPGDQAPGLVFGVVVALVYAATRFAVDPVLVPSLPGGDVVSVGVALAVVALFVAPGVLHLVAALQTLLLLVLAPDRGGVSQTVQVLAYATAPAAFAGLPLPGVAAVAGLYGTLLLAVGISEVHGTSVGRGLVAAAVPAALVFGYGYGGFAAAQAVLGG